VESFSLPHNDVIAVHAYRPVMRPAPSRGIRVSGQPPDAEGAGRYRMMYERAAADRAAGICLWNVGAQTVGTYL
jgi:hypothetical protein